MYLLPSPSFHMKTKIRNLIIDADGKIGDFDRCVKEHSIPTRRTLRSSTPIFSESDIAHSSGGRTRNDTWQQHRESDFEKNDVEDEHNEVMTTDSWTERKRSRRISSSGIDCTNKFLLEPSSRHSTDGMNLVHSYLGDADEDPEVTECKAVFNKTVYLDHDAESAEPQEMEAIQVEEAMRLSQQAIVSNKYDSVSRNDYSESDNRGENKHYNSIIDLVDNDDDS